MVWDAEQSLAETFQRHYFVSGYGDKFNTSILQKQDFCLQNFP